MAAICRSSENFSRLGPMLTKTKKKSLKIEFSKFQESQRTTYPLGLTKIRKKIVIKKKENVFYLQKFTKHPNVYGPGEAKTKI